MRYMASPNTEFGQVYYIWQYEGMESLKGRPVTVLENCHEAALRILGSPRYHDDTVLIDFIQAIEETLDPSDDEFAEELQAAVEAERSMEEELQAMCEPSFHSVLHQVAAPGFDPDTYDPELISMRDTIEENVPTDGTRHTLFLHRRTNTFYVRFHDWKNGQEPQLVDVPKGKSPNECYEHPVGMLGL